jgi:hypothetical protein
VFGEALWSIWLELSTWLLIGAAAAGALHVLLPPDWVQQQLSGRLAVLKAVLLGVPLPLCSCGVIPAALSLRKQGASAGASVAFLISTPQTGVDSILVSGSFLGWPFALAKVVAAFATGLLGGWLTDAVIHAPPPAAPAVPVPPTAPQPKRTWRDGVAHALELLQTLWRWLVIGALLSAALTSIVPASSLAKLQDHVLVASLITLALSVPLYVCATASVPIASALVATGLPIGAAMVFLMAGPATNVATLLAVHHSLGRKALGVYLGTIVAGSLLFGWVFQAMLPEVIRDSHAHHEIHQHTSTTSIVAAALLLAIVVRFAWMDAWVLLQRLAARLSPPVAPTCNIAVDGMTCDGCARRLEVVLRRVEGVEDAQVSHEKGVATVAGRVDAEVLREAVRQAGFVPKQ